jgi:hypothetical protein
MRPLPDGKVPPVSDPSDSPPDHVLPYNAPELDRLRASAERDPFFTATRAKFRRLLRNLDGAEQRAGLELQALRQRWNACENRLAQAETELERVKRAAQPFASYFSVVEDGLHASLPAPDAYRLGPLVAVAGARHRITFGHLRTLKAVLGGAPTLPPPPAPSPSALRPEDLLELSVLAATANGQRTDAGVVPQALRVPASELVMALWSAAGRLEDLQQITRGKGTWAVTGAGMARLERHVKNLQVAGDDGSVTQDGAAPGPPSAESWTALLGQLAAAAAGAGLE